MVQTVHNCGVPQLRCPVKVVDVLCSSSTRCGRPCDYAVTGFAVGCASDSVHRRVVDISVASQRLVPQCLLCRRPEIPWCSSGMVVDTPVGVQTTGLWFRQCRKLWLPQVQCPDKAGRPFDCRPQIQSSPESADMSVATETSSLSAWMAALKGLFTNFPNFSCSSGFLPELSAMPISTAFVDIHIRLTLARV